MPAVAQAGRRVAAGVTRVTEGVRARRAVLEEIEHLDPEVDYHRITQLTLGRVFGDAFFHQALFSVAYYRQVAVETIGPIIARNGYGDTLSDLRKRNNDSLLFFGLIYRDGPDAAEGHRTIDRLSKIHKTFDIKMDDYRYTIASLCFEPVRMPELLGIDDALTEKEQRAIFLFWRGVGREWGVEIPEEQEEFRRWFDKYEEDTYVYSDDCHGVSLAMEKVFLDRFAPWGPLRWVGSQFLKSLCDQRLLDAAGFDPPKPVMKKASTVAVKAYLKGRRALPYAAKDGALIEPWTELYGRTPDSSEIGPKWAKNIQVEPREAAGKCPF
ncbi:MAG: oxygenase MpaB family protein [Sporichthyaceae bacterium]